MSTDPFVVEINSVDPAELMWHLGGGEQTLIVDGDGQILAAVVPVGSWYPGAKVPAGTTVKRRELGATWAGEVSAEDWAARRKDAAEGAGAP